MIRLIKDWALALVVGIAVFLLADWMSDAPAPKSMTEAPAFTLVNADGGTTSLAEFKGRTVVVNFWGSWCGPCRKEIPEFARFAKKHPEVTVLGIAQGSGSGATLAASAKALGINYPVLEATDAVLQDYGVSGYPTTFVVGPDGRIRKSWGGMIDGFTLEAGIGL